MKNMRLFLGLSLGLLTASAALAHHGTANYETTKSVSVTGTVTDFNFTNPHVQIFMDVKDATGKIAKWQGELTSPNHLSRSGWHKDTIKPGDVITISGFPTKSGTPEIWIQKVVLADGTQLDTSGGN
jgi:DNA/RNA endonuclease YhcR with UshA esterase domain